MKQLSITIFLLVFLTHLKAQNGNIIQSKSFDEIKVSVVNYPTGQFILKLNFLGENDSMCDQATLLTIIESLKNADTKKEYSNFYRLKIKGNQIKFMVRHEKKSLHIDMGEFDDFRKGNEKKVHRENAQALITYLEQWLDIITCD